MPELPETETIARELQRLLAGRRIARVEVRRGDVVRGSEPNELAARCEGRDVGRVWRRAKTVVIELTGEHYILVQPRFTGAVLVDQPREAVDTDPYVTVVWELADGGRFVYRDVRRLGTVTFADANALREYDARIGAEPLDPSFDTERLSGILRGSQQAVKKVLMDQRLLAGVGNIYANEALWRAGIDPSRPARSVTPNEADRLRAALVEILHASIAERGTTFRDYRDPDNRPGGYAARLMAYGRGGQPCARCGTTLVETNTIDGRSTVLCYRCQA